MKRLCAAIIDVILAEGIGINLVLCNSLQFGESVETIQCNIWEVIPALAC